MEVERHAALNIFVACQFYAALALDICSRRIYESHVTTSMKDMLFVPTVVCDHFSLPQTIHEQKRRQHLKQNIM